MGVRVVTGTAVLAGLLAAGVLAAAPAHAHDTLVSTNPAADSDVARVPASVSLTFNEPVLGIGTGVVVTGPDGAVQSGKAVVVDDTVTQDLLAGSPAGSYTVRWRVTSADGHPVSGTFAFTAKAGGKAAVAATPPPTTTATASAVASNEKKKPGSDTSWTKVLLGAAAGAAIGTAYVISRRRKKDS